MVRAELVTLSPDDIVQIVQYETPEDDEDKAKCLAQLRDAGIAVVCEPHPVVGIGDDPAVSWADLADIAGVAD